MAYTLEQQMARTTGILQALPALVTMLDMGFCAYSNLTYYSYLHVYDFIKEVFTGFMGAGIIWTILVLRYARTTRRNVYRFELIKSTLATALWLWLLLDSIFAPIPHYYQPPPRSEKIAKAAISVVVLFVLYYPTLVYAYLAHKGKVPTSATGEEGEAGESAPLLGT